MGKIIRLTSSFVRPADVTAYAAGDEISNSAAAGSVVRPTFDLNVSGLGPDGFTKGKVLRIGVDITPGSGSLVIVALNFDVFLFKTADVPVAVGDNVTHPIPAATRQKAISICRFDDGAWTNQLGALTAGTSGFQIVSPTVTLPLATPTEVANPSPINFAGSAFTARGLTAVFQALSAWAPLAVANTFGITLDIEASSI